MTVSLLIFLVLCFKGTILDAATILLIVRNLTSWSNKPFIMGDVEDELTLILFTKTLSIAVLKSF
jgi:hypothetical protein